MAADRALDGERQFFAHRKPADRTFSLDKEYVEQMSRLVRLLQLAEDGAESPLTETPAAESQTENTSEASENFIRQLSQIPTAPANAEVLGELRNNSWSAEILALDLQMFLSALPAENDVADVRCRALMLVLQADKLSSGALSTSDAIDSETERNLTDLLTEMQKLSSELQRLIKPNASNGASQEAEALLYVSNHLLKARLSLQTAIVRRSADEIAQQQEAARRKALREREFISMAAVKPAAKPIRRAMVSKRLIAAAALMVFCAFGVRFALTTNGASDIKRDPSVVVLNSAEMPDGAFLADARISSDTLIGVVTEQWNVLSEKEKREKLTAWVQYAKKYGATTVMLINESGEPKGSGSQEEITIDPDFES
jgi:hypothetical protein